MAAGDSDECKIKWSSKLNCKSDEVMLFMFIHFLPVSTPQNADPDLWEGRAINLVEEYSTVLYEAYKQGSFENKQNKKTWSFWNAVFYCGTIYTTIGKLNTLRNAI